MKRILIWGGDSWANQGDSAILSATLAALRRTIPEAEILVASARPRETARLHGVKSIARTPGGVLKALARCDLLLWGGGQLLQNASSKPFLFLQFCLIAAAKLMGKPVICYGQGVGPVTGVVSRLLARVLVNALDAVSVRDEHSYREVKALGVRRRVTITADPAIALESASEQRARAVLSDEGIRKPFVVVSLRRWGHYSSNWLPVRFYARSARWPAGHAQGFRRFEAEVAQLADYIIAEKEAQVLFLPMSPGGDQGDDAIASEVIAMMQRRDGAKVLRERYHPSQLKAMLAEAELVIGARMHSLILACSAGTPGIAISYSGKGESFLASLGLSKYSIPFEEATFATLRPLVDEAWRRRADLSLYLAERVPVLKEAAVRNALLARDVLNSSQNKFFKSGRAPNEWESRGALPSSASSLHALAGVQACSEPVERGFRGVNRSSLRKSAQKFDKQAETWASLYRGASLTRPFVSNSLQARKGAVLELADARPGQVVLDVGCGPGVYAPELLASGGNWIGIDLSRRMLRQAREDLRNYGRAQLLQGSGAALPLRDGSVDVVLCAGVVDYLAVEELQQLVAELYRVLRVNGTLCITATHADPVRWLRSRLPSWLPAPLRVAGPAYFHSARLAAALVKSGFEIEKTLTLPSRPLSGTLILRAKRRKAADKPLEPVGAPGKLL